MTTFLSDLSRTLLRYQNMFYRALFVVMSTDL